MTGPQGTGVLPCMRQIFTAPLAKLSAPAVASSCPSGLTARSLIHGLKSSIDGSHTTPGGLWSPSAQLVSEGGATAVGGVPTVPQPVTVEPPVPAVPLWPA